MTEFTRPNIVLSRCLELDACRYNGQMIPDRVVRALLPYVNVVPVCPEEEIGLGTPRPPVNIVRMRGVDHMIQPSTGRDVTDEMNTFGTRFLSGLQDIDGFILKGRSPSCGLRDTKIYPRVGPSAALGRGSGLFGGTVAAQYPDTPREDEGRLTNARIREHFLTAIFTLAAFRAINRPGAKLADLVEFQARNKLLFMTYNQTRMRALGQVVANARRLRPQEVFQAYASILPLVFSRQPRHQANINTLMHAFGYFSNQLVTREKSHFLEMLEKYRDQILPLSALNQVLKIWIIRFTVTYLAQQTYFEPFPEALTVLPDSGRK